MAIEPITEEVAANLDEAAAAIRMLDARIMSAFAFGVGVGAVVGFIWGYRFNRKKIKAEAFKEAEAEINDMREHYLKKEVALRGEMEKKPVDELVEERGYTDEQKDSGPSVVVEEPVYRRPLRPPVPIIEAPPLVMDDPPGHPLHIEGWDYRTENLARTRNPHLPYIIHMDEFNNELPAYAKTGYMYYPVDDVLADEDDSIIENRDELIGEETLQKFGHGSDDPNIVHVRNNRLQLQIEVQRLPDRAYDVEVLGLSDEDVEQDVHDG